MSEHITDEVWQQATMRGMQLNGIDSASVVCANEAIKYAVCILKKLEGPIGQGMMDATSLDVLQSEIKDLEELIND